ncbi:MAG TPA: GNAT family N-acetyltransferase [Acidobacteriaceae bacterium]|nr:GNAT family N-acetyltransferase [Acidobacteriaceae bacterium]
MDVEVRELRAADVPRIAETYGGPAWHGGAKKWDQRLVEHAHGQRLVLLVVSGDEILGYGSLLWVSGHAPFREAGIPEINDLVVSERCRNQGIGAQLIHALEERARAAKHSKVGVGVGLFKEYGAAQRLYVHLGYVPDGKGMASGGLPVASGDKVLVDDDLVLWLVKDLDAPPKQ